MKKIYFSLILAVGALFTTSCDMDKAPYGSLDETTAIQDMNDISRFRAMFYRNLRSMTNGEWITLQELQMDMFHGLTSNGNRGGVMSNGLITSSYDDIESMWAGAYSCIADANYGITKTQEMIESGDFEGDDITMLKRYQGEAYFQRAFCYYWLADHFCPAYTAANGETAALGAPLVTVYNPSGDVESYPSRSTLNETYKLIEDDLQNAYAEISAYEAIDNSQVAPNASYLSSYAVLALQARVALLKQDYATALSKAEQVINSGVYTLTGIDDYAEMWSEDTGTEVIFRPFASKEELPASLGEYFLSSGENRADYIPTYAMLDMYDEGDVRFDAFFTVYSNLDVEGRTIPAYVFNKFPGNVSLRTGTANNLCNMSKPFRLSEVYLIAAEAAASNNDATKANRYLNDLRAKRIEGYASQNYAGSGLTEQIRNERLKELIGEGFRLSDLRRWGIGFERYPDHPENPNLNNVIVAAGRSLTYLSDDHRFVWPIPATEIDANPNLKGQQNAGY